MKTTFLTPSISRRAGGIADCVRQLGIALTAGGRMEAQVLGLRDAYSDADLPAWKGLPTDLFSPRRPASFGYAPTLDAVLRSSAPDLVHTHGLWTYLSIADRHWSRQAARPYLVSPHGMLDAWALQNSGWKKRIAAQLFERRHLTEAACLHALCASEAESMRAYGLRNPVCVIPNGVDLPPDSEPNTASGFDKDRPSDRKTLLFLGRLHPKKGLLNLLKAWSLVVAQSPALAESWQLRIAGWDQGGHLQALRSLVGELGLGAVVHFVGPLYGEEKAVALRQADAFVLPSFSEGLPLSVLEAWSYRLPVLMTPECNLPEGLAVGAALRADPQPRSLGEALETLFHLTDAERAGMGNHGRTLVERTFTWFQVARQMREVYDWLADGGPRPACVVL